MRPVSVRFRCFGPYIREQEIRFDELAEYGLFLICGETGSDKTTILDAMCCALYGSCSGDIRGELDALALPRTAPEQAASWTPCAASRRTPETRRRWSWSLRATGAGTASGGS